MSNATKFLSGAVGLVIVVLLCAVYITTTNKGRGSINQSMESYDAMVSQFDDIKFSTYADSVASGSDIINLIKNLKASDGVEVKVTSKANAVAVWNNTSGTITGKVTPSGGSQVSCNISDLSDKSKDAYVNSLASFDCTITRNSNGAITSVNFVQR